MPTGNDTALFKCILEDYDEFVYGPFAAIHEQKPDWALGAWITEATVVREALEKLQFVAQEADQLVQNLDQRFRTAVQQFREMKSEQAAPVTKAPVGNETLLPPTVYHPTASKKPVHPNAIWSKSFGIAEEELARRGHIRAATFSEADYTASSLSAGLVQPRPPHGHVFPTVGLRRKGASVPRIFTGSFSQLESDLRKLHIDKVETPVSSSIDRDEPVKVRDFGATPAISPCTSPISMSLQRREALVSRDAEFQDRVVNGEVIKHRRPSNRALTIDDATGGLEAWLAQEPREKDAANLDSAGVRRGCHRHRDNTI